MFYAYILRSKLNNSLYKGFTRNDVSIRLARHNKGQTKHTAKYKPWEIIWFAAFETQKLATDFEKYLKTASGIAFMRKRLIEFDKDIKIKKKSDNIIDIYKSSLRNKLI